MSRTLEESIALHPSRRKDRLSVIGSTDVDALPLEPASNIVSLKREQVVSE